MSFSDHTAPHAAEKSFAEQQELLRDTWLRTTEAMCWDIVRIFTEHPEVTSFSYDQDGDPENYPSFCCLDQQSKDAAGTLGPAFDELVQATEERWNEGTHPAVPAFLSTHEERSFSRDTLGDDLVAACQKSAKAQNFPEGWAASFSAAIKAHLLEQGWKHVEVAPKRSSPRM